MSETPEPCTSQAPERVSYGDSPLAQLQRDYETMAATAARYAARVAAQRRALEQIRDIAEQQPVNWNWQTIRRIVRLAAAALAEEAT